MAGESRRQLPLLLGLLGLLGVVLWWQLGGSSPGPATGTRAAARAGRAGSAAAPPAGRSGSTGPEAQARLLAEGVGLERLTDDRPAPEEGGRDPFRAGGGSPGGGSGADNSPAPAVVPSLPPPPVATLPPPGPPPPPPITVKFIGVVSRSDVGRVAVLSDGKNVYYGRAGEIVDGRWRIVSIGEESLQIEYADGRGRQTVRLTG